MVSDSLESVSIDKDLLSEDRSGDPQHGDGASRSVGVGDQAPMDQGTTSGEDDGCDRRQLIDRPLSWEQARAKVRTVLEDYMKTKPPTFPKNRLESDNSPPRFSWLWKYDLDFYVAALPASVALLCLACMSFTSRQRGYEDSALNARADLDVYKYQIAAASLLLSGTLFSITLTRRRSNTCARDSDVAKRHTILKFLLAMKKMDKEDELNRSIYSGEAPVGSASNSDSTPLSGTSLTDIFPTYRRSVTNPHTGGSWHQIPTLLLVKGDYVALQIGDIAPGKCKMVQIGSPGESSPSIVIGAGERLTLESLGGQATHALSAIPRGRTTLPPDSLDLLTLCNDMRIFVLEETPLEGFLRLPPVEHRPPQLHRQFKAIRSVLFLFAGVIFILTIAIVFIRPDTKHRDLSILLPLPFLAALGVLPVTTPVCAFFLEVLGTTRILVMVDPYSTARTCSPDETVPSEKILFLRYFFATVTSRLSLQEPARRLRAYFRRCSQFKSKNKGYHAFSTHEMPPPGLVHVPPASGYVLEKLGVATSFALVDDELACEPHSSPQQLLIPSGKGLKLLDLCRTYDGEFENESDSDRSPAQGRKGKKTGDDSDSDSDEEQRYQHISLPRRKLKALRRGYRKRAGTNNDDSSSDKREGSSTDENEVQFEDPLWWQHLPSLKCIGLACLLVDHRRKAKGDQLMHGVPSIVSAGSENVRPVSSEMNGLSRSSRHAADVQASAKNSSEIAKHQSVSFAGDLNGGGDAGVFAEELKDAEKSLTKHVCSERSRSQLQSLARCIGFSTEGNTFGYRGDLSPFRELLRLQVISTRLLSERLVIDAHALGLEASRSFGELTVDSTSVIVQDRRSRGYQLLTVGDPRVVTELCQEAWQGENSTILPLSATDKKSIVDTSSNWSLADLDVAAFCYAPVPHTFDQRVLGVTKRHVAGKTEYLVDNPTQTESLHSSSASASENWSLVKNQIFLGVLGSSVIPRKEIEPLIEAFDEAGVRFVYFSPRNMRRTKELASAVGIDVAWNCAISLRPLDEGEDDPHRMTSTYADWDINAKLPHGIDDVRYHLKEVDNVPLLVSLFTDVTKDTTKEMVKTFQDYNDTVIAMGLSHLSRNVGIFAASDLSIGADILTEKVSSSPSTLRHLRSNPIYTLLPYEVSFVSSISAHSCAFNLRGASSTALMPFIIERGRAALEAATSSALFAISGCVSFSLYILFAVCTASTTIPFVPALGSVLYLQIVLPLIGLAMAMSDSDSGSMRRVPPKNDLSETFARNEGRRLYINAFLKALAPAVFPQLLYLIAFGELLIEFEPELVVSTCPLGGKTIDEIWWVSLVRCDGLKEYSGVARTSAGSLTMAEMVLCVVVASSSFVYRAIPIRQEPPWKRNHAWMYSVVLAIGLIAVFLVVALEDGSFGALPWYFFFLAVVMPFVCVYCAEAVKRIDSKHEKRAVMLRRLQFETKLGMWSPK